MQIPATAAPQVDRLFSNWTLYYTEKVTREAKFQDKLMKICTFSTPQEFAYIYARLEKPSQLSPNVSIYAVKSDAKLPIWEEHLSGGTYHYVKKRDAQADRVWERLLFHAIGEKLQEPAISAIQLSTKHDNVTFTIWNFDEINKKLFSRIQLKLGDVLETPVAQIEYTTNFDSIKEKADRQKADEIARAQRKETPADKKDKPVDKKPAQKQEGDKEPKDGSQ